MVPYRAGETEPFVITVQGEDRPGLAYGISEVLSEWGINITNLDARVAFIDQKLEYIQIYRGGYSQGGSTSGSSMKG